MRRTAVFIALGTLLISACEAEKPPGEKADPTQATRAADASVAPETPKPDVEAALPKEEKPAAALAEPSGEAVEAHLDAGAEHACVSRKGAVWCWGAGEQGQLGDGAGVVRSVPVAVKGLPMAEGEPVVELALGLEHSCARTDRGRVFCWGGGEHGELGDGATERRLEAVRVEALPAARQVAAGSHSSCALTRDARVFCWGGPGAFETQTTPRELRAFQGAEELALGDHQLCGRYAGGVVRCQSFQAGVARQVPELEGATRLVMSPHDALGCALVAEKPPVCWAPSADGALGAATLPVEGPVEALSVGPHSCFIAGPERGISCWGVGRDGALGDGEVERRERPVTVAALTGPAREVAVGERFSCALLEDGSVRCWGAGERGQLGAGEDAMESTPTPVTPVFAKE